MTLAQLLEALKNFTLPNTLFELQEQLQALEEYSIALLDSAETEEDEATITESWNQFQHKVFTKLVKG